MRNKKNTSLLAGYFSSNVFFEKKILARPTVEDGFVSLLETSAQLLRSLNRLYSEIETAARSD